ncbi:hypothetical protein NPIL_490931 [Nephila pilipes]|uniref:Uncharacterized protein n=1 Tax=Nephila pilipes TaxID=299642 RepID=A0A8X6R1K3_NEPPI|nr:hypothetical protein NPIL_490931 [Nephila pilipes]
MLPENSKIEKSTRHVVKLFASTDLERTKERYTRLKINRNRASTSRTAKRFKEGDTRIEILREPSSTSKLAVTSE